MAFMHVPRFTSGPYGPAPWLQPIWGVLYEGGVKILLSGHDHHYERFGPQDSEGRSDVTRGVRQFVIGTGGIGLNAVSGS